MSGADITTTPNWPAICPWGERTKPRPWCSSVRAVLDHTLAPPCIDACFSGGIAKELVESVPNLIGSTTCTQKGYTQDWIKQTKKTTLSNGYDNGETQSGAWTDTFLTQGLRQLGIDENIDLGLFFQQCHRTYTKTYRSRGDWPCFFGRIGDFTINTNDNPDTDVPIGTFWLRDWLLSSNSP